MQSRIPSAGLCSKGIGRLIPSSNTSYTLLAIYTTKNAGDNMTSKRYIFMTLHSMGIHIHKQPVECSADGPMFHT